MHHRHNRYEDHPIGLLKAPREEWSPPYNYSGKDHHPLVAGQPILDAQDAALIDQEYLIFLTYLLFMIIFLFILN